MTNEINDKAIGEEIVKSFHEQFAQNQNHHQKLFLQVLAVLLTVIAGFGYLYIRLGVQAKDINVTVETIYVFLTLALYLLSLAIALIANMALGFRRDQLVACNIRAKTGVIDIQDSNDNSYFIGSFNPVGKVKYLLWMPEFHLIFFIALFAVKIMFIGSIFLNENCKLVFALPPNTLLTSSVIMIILSFAVDIFVSIRYWIKWKKYSDAAPARLKKEKKETKTSNQSVQ